MITIKLTATRIYHCPTQPALGPGQVIGISGAGPSGRHSLGLVHAEHGMVRHLENAKGWPNLWDMGVSIHGIPPIYGGLMGSG